MISLQSILILLAACGTSFLVMTQSPCTNNQTEKVEIVCWFIAKSYSLAPAGTVLTFYADSSVISTFSDSTVFSVLHSNKTEITELSDIKALELSNAKLHFIPHGIRKHFPSLKFLIIEFCGLLSVNKENLKEFGDSLKELYLQRNNLISIDADLFEYNPNLLVFVLDDNPIRHIDPEFYTNLRNLKKIEVGALRSAGCIQNSFNIFRGDNIAYFAWHNGKCNDITAKLETQALVKEKNQTLVCSDHQ